MGLVVSRKEGEVIDIDNGSIVIHVDHIKGNRVSLRIDAERSLLIVRGELRVTRTAEQLKEQFNQGAVSLQSVEQSLQLIPYIRFDQLVESFEAITGQSYDAYRRLPTHE